LVDIQARSILQCPKCRWRFSEHFQRAFERGEPLALFSALAIAMDTYTAVPAWAKQGFFAGFEQVCRNEVRSWDAAFGAPVPKGVHLATRRQRHRRLMAAYTVWQKHQAGAPLDDTLFERVGRKFGLGKTVCKQAYYQIRRRNWVPE
jgi:hypothetical protein